ncbi:MAG: SurA N-terminal domain-containing protein [Spirochaetaceae bacterium]|jgi:parvulin-like peptidyl-prolyl isomerase|nr:SurA N-terminal domain-containing protein [Spirochaetaceae bacterium]
MKRIILFFALLGILSGGVFAQSDLQSVAIVRLTRSEPITVKQLRTEVERAEQTAGRALTPAERRQVLDVMINERLALQAAERDNVSVSDAEVNQQLQQLRAILAQNIGHPPSDADFEQAVRNESGLDVSGFREQLKRQATVQKYLLNKKRNLFEGISPPTEVEIASAYSLSRTTFIRPETVRFSFILVPGGANAEESARARAQAEQLLRDIGGNTGRFDDAIIRAGAPNSSYRGGDGGYIPRNVQAQQVMGADFVNSAFALRQGEVSRIIESPRGYMIIKITETLEQKNLELTDIAQPGTNLTVRDYISNTLLQERQTQVFETAQRELITELRQGNSFQIFENYLNF